MDQEKKVGFEGCEVEYNVDPPKQIAGRNSTIYGPFLNKFIENEDALTVRIKANDRQQAANIATGLRQASIKAGYDSISIRQVNNVYVYVSKN